jgi:hypothetical protein
MEDLYKYWPSLIASLIAWYTIKYYRAHDHMFCLCTTHVDDFLCFIHVVSCFFRGKENIQLDRTYGSMFQRLRDAEDNNGKNKQNVRKTRLDRWAHPRNESTLEKRQTLKLITHATKGGPRSSLKLVTYKLILEVPMLLPWNPH